MIEREKRIKATTQIEKMGGDEEKNARTCIEMRGREGGGRQGHDLRKKIKYFIKLTINDECIPEHTSTQLCYISSAAVCHMSLLKTLKLMIRTCFCCLISGKLL